MHPSEFPTVLVASHGTPGAQAAEALAIRLCARGGLLLHLVVVPELWRGMMGDDWLNNASTRAAYGRYLEGELGREVDTHVARVRAAAGSSALDYRPHIEIGDPTACLEKHANANAPALVVIGSRRPRGIEGLRSRMRIERLIGRLPFPLLIVPHP